MNYPFSQAEWLGAVHKPLTLNNPKEHYGAPSYCTSTMIRHCTHSIDSKEPYKEPEGIQKILNSMNDLKPTAINLFFLEKVEMHCNKTKKMKRTTKRRQNKKTIHIFWTPYPKMWLIIHWLNFLTMIRVHTITCNGF